MIQEGPVMNCPPRTWPEPTRGRDGYACPRCGMYHNANGGLFIGPCVTEGCRYASLPGGGMHTGRCAGPHGEGLA
jgi:hypothetical protein